MQETDNLIAQTGEVQQTPDLNSDSYSSMLFALFKQKAALRCASSHMLQIIKWDSKPTP